MRPKKNSKNPELAQAAANADADDGVYWPGEGLRTPGVIGKKKIKVGSGKIVEETKIPTVR